MKTSEELRKAFIDCLLDEKSYEELNVGEKALIKEEIGSKEAYENLQKVNTRLLHLSEEKLPEPKPKILQDLKSVFQDTQKAKKRKTSFLLKKWELPTYQLAAAVVILIALFVFTQPSQTPATIVQVKEVITQDTLYIETPPDTVFIHQYITKIVKEPVYVQNADSTSSSSLTRLESEKLQEYRERINQHKGYSIDEKEFLLTLNVEVE